MTKMITADPRMLPGQRSPLDVMTFLTEVELQYPDAISLASGKPADQFFDFDRWLLSVGHFIEHDARQRRSDWHASGRRLAQYSRATGLMNTVVAEQVAKDYGVLFEPEEVVITNGCQEAIALAIPALCPGPGDVILAPNPIYIGLLGAARLCGVDVVPVEIDPAGSILVGLPRALAELSAQGKRARALYLIPDFDNPLGSVMPLAEREAILELCGDHEIVVLEDSTYALFRFEGETIPPLARLDQNGSVLYLGTYSKTLCPGVRVGYAVIPKRLRGSRATMTSVAERKYFTSMSTSHVSQALVAGVLLENGLSLGPVVRPATEHYRINRDTMLRALEANFSGTSPVRWNYPQGGFFVTLQLPISFGESEMVRCANDYGVTVMPTSFFAVREGRRDCIRLSFSNVSPEDIITGVERLALFVGDSLEVECNS